MPGGCHGGWWWDSVTEVLAARGHHVDALTLLGLEDQPDTDRRINLDSHIQRVCDAVLAAGTGPDSHRPVVLVAHSYGRLPSTAAADRHPDTVPALVLLDAMLPLDGDSCWSLTDQRQRDWFVAGAARTGNGVDPYASAAPRTRSHPLGSLLQQVQLTSAWRRVPVRHHVSIPWRGESPLAASTAHAREDGDLVLNDWPTAHDVLREGPTRYSPCWRRPTLSWHRYRGGCAISPHRTLP